MSINIALAPRGGARPRGVFYNKVVRHAKRAALCFIYSIFKLWQALLPDCVFLWRAVGKGNNLPLFRRPRKQAEVEV